MQTLQWTRRLLAALAVVASVLGVTTAVAPAADAAVFGSCTQTRCSAAREANSTWSSMGYPSRRDWYDWPSGRCNFAGGTFQNREGLLPDRAEGHYREYTVPTPGEDDRGARRIVAGANGERYWTADHYASFAWIAR